MSIENTAAPDDDKPKTYPNPFLAYGWPPKPTPGFVFLSASRK